MTNPSPPDRRNITKEEINALPLGAFPGKVTLITDRNTLNEAFRELADQKVVGFDTETKPVFVRGQRHQVALMQIAQEKKVFLLRIKSLGLTDEIVDFLESHHIEKAGVGIRDDIQALQRMKRFEPKGFIELSEIARQAGYEVESVKKLTALLLGFRISKSAQTSNWEAERLDAKQVSYAATDAWVCLEIYRKLTNYR